MMGQRVDRTSPDGTLERMTWANTDSRIEIIADHGEVMITVVYEGDMEDEVSIYMPRQEFDRLIHDARRLKQ